MLAILDTDLETGSFLLIVVHGGGTISHNFIIPQLRILRGITDPIHRILMRMRC
jgi:hypothetical protein